MKLTYQAWAFLHEVKHTLKQILRNQVTFQEKIMSAFDDLQQVVQDVVTSNTDLANEVGKFPGLIDTMEARITDAIKKIVTPAQLAQVTGAVDALRTVATATANAAGVAAKAAADALDGIDEADVVVVPDPVVFPTNFPAPSQPAFNDAAAAYKAAGGADGIRLDGVEMQPSTSGTFLERYSHTATGDINDVGPTD